MIPRLDLTDLFRMPNLDNGEVSRRVEAWAAECEREVNAMRAEVTELKLQLQALTSVLQREQVTTQAEISASARTLRKATRTAHAEDTNPMAAQICGRCGCAINDGNAGGFVKDIGAVCAACS